MPTESTSLLHLVPDLVPETSPESSPKRPRKRRKARSPHPGVKLLKPEGWPAAAPDGARNPHWRARYLDPDSRKTRTVTLGGRPSVDWPTAAAARNSEQREAVCVLIAKHVQGRRNAFTGGAERFTGGDAELASTPGKPGVFDQYWTGIGARKRPATQRAYRRGVNRFLAWCALAGVVYARQVTQSTLRRYREHLIALQHEGQPRAATTVNRDLKWLGAVLGELAKDGKLSLTREAMKVGLEKLAERKVRRGFYRSATLRAILAACAKHDLVAYDGAFSGRALATVLFILLSGLRAKEAVQLQWKYIISDEDGTRIHVPDHIAKKFERWIELEHSPLLAHVLSAHASHDPEALILGGGADALDELRWLLADEYGAPEFESQGLRRTCGTFLACAPRIFGAAAAHMAAGQLGHSIGIAQKHYQGQVKVDLDARTTEAAMDLRLTLEETRPL